MEQTAIDKLFEYGIAGIFILVLIYAIREMRNENRELTKQVLQLSLDMVQSQTQNTTILNTLTDKIEAANRREEQIMEIARTACRYKQS